MKINTYIKELNHQQKVAEYLKIHYPSVIIKEKGSPNFSMQGLANREDAIFYCSVFQGGDYVYARLISYREFVIDDKRYIVYDKNLTPASYRLIDESKWMLNRAAIKKNSFSAETMKKICNAFIVALVKSPVQSFIIKSIKKNTLPKYIKSKMIWL